MTRFGPMAIRVEESAFVAEPDVPCNGCTACCRDRTAVFIHAINFDDPSQYETVPYTCPVTGLHGARLQFQPNGDCVYLDREKGCTIYDRRPMMCRVFDCRAFARNHAIKPRAERRRLAKMGIFDDEILRRGRELNEAPA